MGEQVMVEQCGSEGDRRDCQSDGPGGFEGEGFVKLAMQAAFLQGFAERLAVDETAVEDLLGCAGRGADVRGWRDELSL